MTINEIIEKLRAENPEPYAQTNGVKYKMVGDELEDYYASSAQLIFEQNQKEAETLAKAEAKSALLDKLGITSDEAALLLS